MRIIHCSDTKYPVIHITFHESGIATVCSGSANVRLSTLFVYAHFDRVIGDFEWACVFVINGIPVASASMESSLLNCYEREQ